VTVTLAHDEHWPRAGDWPTWSPGERADAIIIGLPTWRTSLSPTRAHETPAAIRAALRRYSADALLTPAGIPLVVRDAGDIADPDGAGEEAATARVAELSAHAELVVVLGGDNAATVPAALGVWGEQVERAGLVTLDAHHDLRDGVSNGSPVRRLLEAGLDGARVSQLGIEPLANSRFYADRAAAHRISVVTRGELAHSSIAAETAAALDRAASAGGPVHVDLDLDVCDRAVAPGCPASIPGGISAHDLRRAAHVAGAHAAVRGIDLTELDSSADSADGRTVRLAALCVLEALAGLATRTTRRVSGEGAP
jgi:formiminoglutamase